MPPRANRQPKRAQDSTPKPRNEKLSFVDRVHLPALQDTPSSRRQYSYGAAVEPLAPRRPVGDHEQYDLRTAISAALERQAQELAQERVNFPQPTQPAPAPSPARKVKPSIRKTTRESDMDDELASAAFPPPRKGDSVAASEADDVRSFGIESDVYGDATIASTPDVTNDTGLNLGHRSVNRRDARRRGTKGPTDPAFRDTASDESSGDELGVRRSLRRRKQATKVIEKEPENPKAPSKATPDLVNGSPKGLSQSSRNRLANSDSAEVSPKPSSSRVQAGQLPAKSTSPNSLAKQAQMKQFEADQRQRAARKEAEAEASRQRTTRQAAEAAAAPRRGAQVAEVDDSSNSSTSDHSERDSALQEDVQARADATASESGSERHRQTWQQRWDYMQSMSPSNYLRSRFRQVPVTHVDEDEEVEDAPASNWVKLFSLQEYLDAFRRLCAWLYGVAIRARDGIVARLPSLYTFLTTLAALAVLLAGLNGLQTLGQSDDLFNDSKLSIFSSLDSLKQFSGNLGSYLPTIAWPTHSGLEDRFDLADFMKNGKFDVENFLDSYVDQIQLIKKAGIMHHTAIKKLEEALPKVVHVNLDGEKPIVAQEFWYALRELIQKDNGIFTLQEDGQLSEKQWNMVSSRILGDARLESKLSDSAKATEGRMDQKMDQKISSLWDTWIKENDARIIKEQDRPNSPAGGAVVSKDEFLRVLKTEFAIHRSEIKAEFNELQPQVQRLVLETVDRYGLNKNDGIKLSDSARAEVSTIVNRAVGDALANANIEALTRGKIQHHWDLILKNQINFFSMGSGATVNVQHSSATYDPYKRGIVDRQDLQDGLRGARRWHQNEALRGWSEDGDKWCAASGINVEGKPHGYMLAVQLARPVVPQYVVVEHILPGATIDPDARPRDIEVYAQIEDPEVRERVLDFSATHIGQSRDEEATAPLSEDMVRIGRFTYAGAEAHDGVYVHQLSSELARLEAETTEVVIRAVNNYGAPDHTCFYRVRMYGSTDEGEMVVDLPNDKKPLWQKVFGS